MELWLRRLFWLAALAIGVGGTLLYLYLKKGLPSTEPIYYLWPWATTSLAAIALIGVLHAWRERHADLRGLLQWRLSDLLTASLLTGALMTVLSTLRPQSVPAFDIPLSMVSGFGFAVGLLVAARISLTGWKTRHLYAIGFSLRVLGLMALALNL